MEKTTKTMIHCLLVERTYDHLDPVANLIEYLEKNNITYIFHVDKFFFLTEEDLMQAKWVL